MVWLARIAPLKDGEVPPQPDGGTKGWLRVFHKGETKWARPCFPWGSFSAPTEHWTRKFQKNWGVLVVGEASPYGEELEDHLFYIGFVPLEGGLQTDVADAYPQQRLRFTERWEVILDDKPGDPAITLRYVGDPDNDANPPAAPGAVMVKLSQKPGDESIFIDHIVDGAPIGTNIKVDVNGTVTTNVAKNMITVVEENTDTHVKGTSTSVVDMKVTSTFNDELEHTGAKKTTITLNDELMATIVKKTTLQLQDELAAQVAKKVTLTLQDELVAQVAKMVTLTLQDELVADITKKVTLTVAAEVVASVSSKFDIQVDSQPGLKVEGGKATVGTGAESGVIFSALSNAWSTVMASIASHTHDVVFGACTAGGTTGTAPTAPSSSLSSIASSPPISLAECSKLKIPAFGP